VCGVGVIALAKTRVNEAAKWRAETSTSPKTRETGAARASKPTSERELMWVGMPGVGTYRYVETRRGVVVAYPRCDPAEWL
jgi:hypothetical protein